MNELLTKLVIEIKISDLVQLDITLVVLIVILMTVHATRNRYQLLVCNNHCSKFSPVKLGMIGPNISCQKRSSP